MMNPKQKLLEKKYVEFCLSKADPKHAAKGFAKSVQEAVEKALRSRKPEVKPEVKKV